MDNRKTKAEEILYSIYRGKYIYLGEGSQGVVFHDQVNVYKVFLNDWVHTDTHKDEMRYLKSILPIINQSRYTYPIIEFKQLGDICILVYPYEPSSAVRLFRQDEMIDFLANLWQLKLVMLNIKPENFVKLQSQIRLIDYEFVPYTDNLFLNMCVRTFIYLKYAEKYESTSLAKLNRSAINNFSLPELEGVQKFVNDVFGRVIYLESKLAISENNFDTNRSIPEIKIYDSKLNLEHLFFRNLKTNRYLRKIAIGNVSLDKNNYFIPETIQLYFDPINCTKEKVSLLIKTCSQDVKTIEQNIKHIVKQLSFPDSFHEIVISVDSKETDFLREYHSKGTLNDLTSILNKLIDECVVDRYILFDEGHITDINKRWFNISSEFSHSEKNAPVASQLYAFEQLSGDYILQMDSDILIARRSESHSFLNDMLAELKANNHVISVGFNICQDADMKIEYHGFDQGGFVPEVRFGLFDKNRLFNLRPLYNELNTKGELKLSWFRALHITQKNTGTCSLRGGDSRSFYIHPQNYRKTDPDSWMTILDRVEQGFIPKLQYNEFDCMGNLFDWTIPKRTAPMVVVCLLHNIPYGRFLRMWFSVLSQTFTEWEMIIVDDVSTNGLPLFIEGVIADHKHRVTLIKNRFRLGGMANLYKVIHYFVSNPDSIIVTVDGDDALIGRNALQDIYDKYRLAGADLVVGRMYQNYRLQAHYRYPANFINPRQTGGNVWQHTRSFRKYLFNGLKISDLKFNGDKDIFQQLSADWITLCSDYAYMVPLVEMSTNPMQMNTMNYYYERSVLHTTEMKLAEEAVIANILQRQSKKILKKNNGRIDFMPNTEKIEIDLTYACNLKCTGCNRSCTQAPTSEEMSFDQIQLFVNDSKALNKRWEVISLLGGEPTLHSQFEEIVLYIINHYIKDFSPTTILKIVSNGYSLKSRETLKSLTIYPEVYIDWSSIKTSNSIPYFSDFNDAPIDDMCFINEDFSKGCWVTNYCGISLNSQGYFACSLCGGINRVMKSDKGIPKLSDVNSELLKKQLDEFCRLCGNFKSYQPTKGDIMPRSAKAPFQNRISESWLKIYNLYNNTKHEI